MDAEAGAPGGRASGRLRSTLTAAGSFSVGKEPAPPFPGPFPSRLLGVSEQNNLTNSSGDVSLVERLEA